MNAPIRQDGYKITVRRATVMDGLKRGAMVNQALENPQEDPLKQTAAVVLYPACTAVSEVEKDGEPVQMDFETFLQLPETLVDAWMEAVRAVNPHWFPEEARPKA